ncbi:hypothetical protein BpHYR1_021696 [Brachionus plicatilis]|uniref:Uncharacterized protein n=1 Tax=Brachionus plicatilis TaxID=10195 RepID=A0A3M7T5Y3_BRAPC|nr:hypothetical protein BpHYR1_021696 [Brachionus plicatilis]
MIHSCSRFFCLLSTFKKENFPFLLNSCIRLLSIWTQSLLFELNEFFMTSNVNDMTQMSLRN